MLLLGAPGTGKTTSLINKIREIKPEHFGFLSFTRQAANEAKARLMTLYPEKELDYVRTIHSLAFKILRLNRGSMFTDHHLSNFGNECGFEFSNKHFYEEDGTFDELTEDDIIYRLMQINETQGIKLEDENIDWEAIQYMKTKYVQYKKDKDLVDFNDILKLCINKSLPKFDLLCVDEAQDLSPLQFIVVNKLVENSKEVIYAGDDDQMIYEFAGVKRSIFMNLANKEDQEILSINWRLPWDIISKSQRVIEKCKNRIDKTKNISASKIESTVNWQRAYDFEEALQAYDYRNKTCLILARNNFFLRDIRNQLDDLGLGWNYLKSTNSLEKQHNIQISTIHGSKGAEADVVILFTDVTNSTYQNITSDAEHRVWYVGMTRTKNQLIIVEPTSKYSYDL